LFLQGSQEHYIKNLLNVSRVSGKHNNSYLLTYLLTDLFIYLFTYLLTSENRDNIIRYVTWAIVCQKHPFACFELFRLL
jgi:hypothetical protein